MTYYINKDRKLLRLELMQGNLKNKLKEIEDKEKIKIVGLVKHKKCGLIHVFFFEIE